MADETTDPAVEVTISAEVLGWAESEEGKAYIAKDAERAAAYEAEQKAYELSLVANVPEQMPTDFTEQVDSTPEDPTVPFVADEAPAGEPVDIVAGPDDTATTENNV